jgi:hypothetical protein
VAMLASSTRPASSKGVTVIGMTPASSGDMRPPLTGDVG